MKQATDNRTIELPMPGAKRGRGRPTTGAAMTNAERQKAYRERVKNTGSNRAPRTLHEVKFELDTRPTWDNMHDLETALAAKEMLIGQLKKEEALLIAERGKAFDAAKHMERRAGELMRENEKLTALNVTLVTKYDEERRRVAHLEAAEHQAANLFQSLETERKAHQATVKNRNALQKKSDAIIAELTAENNRLADLTTAVDVQPKKRNASRKKTVIAEQSDNQ